MKIGRPSSVRFTPFLIVCVGIFCWSCNPPPSRVLVIDGQNLQGPQQPICGVSLNTAELYESGSNSFAADGQTLDARDHFALVEMLDARILVAGGWHVAYDNDGRVLIAGGWSFRPGCGGPCYLSSTEIFDGQSLSAGPDMNALRGAHGAVNVQYEVIVGSATSLVKYADRPARR